MKFADAVIIICLIMAIIITITTLTLQILLLQPITSDIIIALFGFWGGELLILALRQVFGRDILQKQVSVAEDDNDGMVE